MNKIIYRYNKYYKLINIYDTDDEEEEEWLPNLDEFYEDNDYDYHYINYGITLVLKDQIISPRRGQSYYAVIMFT